MARFLAFVAGLMLMAGAAAAQRTDIVVGMQLEPPNLDPTAGAAAAIDEVVYANVFEGLTRYADDGSIRPALAEAGRSRPTASRGSSTCARASRSTTAFPSPPRTWSSRSTGRWPRDRPTPRSSSSPASTRSPPSTTSPWRSASTSRRDRSSTISPGATRSSSPRPARTAMRPSRSAPGRSSSRSGCRATGRAGAEPGLLGRAGQARQGYLQVHLRPDRRLLGDDGGRHRCLPELSRARRTSRSSRPTRASR